MNKLKIGEQFTKDRSTLAIYTPRRCLISPCSKLKTALARHASTNATPPQMWHTAPKSEALRSLPTNHKRVQAGSVTASRCGACPYHDLANISLKIVDFSFVLWREAIHTYFSRPRVWKAIALPFLFVASIYLNLTFRHFSIGF